MIRLTGKCVGCGTCCEYMQFVLPGGDVVKEWARARQFPGRLEVIQENGAYIELKLYCPCPHLKDGECDIHLDKPAVCREYPKGMPEYWLSKGLDPNKSLGEKCGYRWSQNS